MTASNKRLSISLGGMCEQLATQVRAQGFRVQTGIANEYQRLADAILSMKVRGILPEREAQRARSRLIEQFVRNVHG